MSNLQHAIVKHAVTHAVHHMSRSPSMSNAKLFFGVLVGLSIVFAPWTLAILITIIQLIRS